MPIAVTSQQIQDLIDKVENGDITAGYRSLSALGFHYADWAFGVANGNTIAGVSALNFLEGTALAGVDSLTCQALSQERIQSIKKGMALAYLDVLAAQAEDNGGIASQDINASDVWKIHSDVFIANGLSIQNWTLDAPFRIIEKLFGSETVETVWVQLRDTGGYYADASLWNLKILAFMWAESGDPDPEIQAWADTWMKNVPVFSHLYNEMSWGGALKFLIDGIVEWVPPALNIKDILTDLGGGIFDLLISPDYGDAPLSENKILIGSKGIDSINGTEKAEILYGGAGDDTLIGGGGNDFLQGGLGNDTYVYTKGDGFDAIVDTDGQGQIVEDGIVLGVGKQYGDNRVYQFTDANNKRHNYVFVNGNRDTGGDIVVDGTILIKGFQAGNLGLNMTAPETEPQLNLTPETIDPPIVGDLEALDTDPTAEGIQSGLDEWGNVLVDPNKPKPDQADALNDTPDNDHIISGGGDDTIVALRGGNDLIEAGEGKDGVFSHDGNDVVKAGAGDDIVYGGKGDDILLGEADRDKLNGEEGKDTLIGGTSGDILSGGADDDKLYAEDHISVAEAIANGNTQVGSGLKGDWLSGEKGDDTLVGGIGNDVLAGGSGNDLLIGGAGDDHIIGDANWLAQDFNWNVTNTNGQYIYNGAVGETAPADFGNDVIYAGKGDDYVWTGQGNDVIFGEDGNDSLNADEGNDIISGGGGSDIVNGEQGDDVLIGGTGNDSLIGDSGYDTYIINAGDGIDGIIDSDNGNSLVLGAGIDKNNIKLSLTQSTLFADDPTVYAALSLDLGNGNFANIYGFNQNDVYSTSSVSTFNFADGSTLSLDQLLARGFVLAGTGADDTIYGTNISDRIDGLGGSDRLIGGAGDDVYVNVTGDTINDTEGHSTIQLAQANGIGGGGLAVTYYGNQGQYRRLDITLDNGEILKLEDAFYGTEATLQFANGSRMDLETLVGASLTTSLNLNLGNGGGKLYGGAGADYLYGGSGNDNLLGNKGDDTLTGSSGNDSLIGGAGFDKLYGGSGNDTLEGNGEGDILFGGEADDKLYGGDASDSLYGDSGDDLLVGGTGNDYLEGGYGSDAYVFEQGWGQDTVFNYDDSNDKIDTIQFGSGISIADLNFRRSGSLGSDLEINSKLTPDRLTVHGYFKNDGAGISKVEKIRFADGIVWDVSTVKAKVIETDDFSNTVRGFSTDEIINGMGGNDYLYGGGGDDRLIGGTENDYLDGEDGNDVLEGGIGNDYLINSTGSDTFVFDRGWGLDTIHNNDYGASNTDTIQFGTGISANENYYMEFSQRHDN